MKHLYRSKVDRKIAGVCAGVAHYFSLDPSLVRIIWVAASLWCGVGILLYLISWLVIPQVSQEITPDTPLRPLERSKTHKILAGVCGGIGEYFDIDPVFVRIIFLTFTILGGWGIILYMVLWIAMAKAKK